MRQCTQCGQEKLSSEFYLRYGKPRNKCKECTARQWQEWRRREKSTYEAYTIARKQSRLLEKYGIDLETYQRMRDEQEDCCAICETKFDNTQLGRANVDHDHETMDVRGLLCGRCNRALGGFRDDLKLLDRATSYLRGEL